MDGESWFLTDLERLKTISLLIWLWHCQQARLRLELLVDRSAFPNIINYCESRSSWGIVQFSLVGSSDSLMIFVVDLYAIFKPFYKFLICSNPFSVKVHFRSVHENLHTAILVDKMNRYLPYHSFSLSHLLGLCLLENYFLWSRENNFIFMRKKVESSMMLIYWYLKNDNKS